MLTIDRKKVEDFALTIKDRIKIRPSDFSDGILFPSKNADRESVLNFFFFMVAIDHRTSKTDSFRGIIDGKEYKGSDLMYRLAMLKFQQDPSFFDPHNMKKITGRDIKEWLSISEPTKVIIHEPDTRAFLLRDAAIKLIKLYDGSVENLIRRSQEMLYNPPEGGFVERLKVFRAYEDPVEKKPLLLAKFLERRGLLKIRDKHSKHVPVDNHLTRIAIRIGLVEIVDKELFNAFMWRREASREEDILIRMIIRQAYDLVSKRMFIDPFVLDDFLWSFGRTTCLPRNPRCFGDNTQGQLCPFLKICKAHEDRDRRLMKEHLYFSTWYY